MSGFVGPSEAETKSRIKKDKKNKMENLKQQNKGKKENMNY